MSVPNQTLLLQVVTAELLPPHVRTIANSIIICFAFVMGFIASKTFVDFVLLMGKFVTICSWSSWGTSLQASLDFVLLMGKFVTTCTWSSWGTSKPFLTLSSSWVSCHYLHLVFMRVLQAFLDFVLLMGKLSLLTLCLHDRPPSLSWLCPSHG